jgi:hypothetical protein
MPVKYGYWVIRYLLKSVTQTTVWFISGDRTLIIGIKISLAAPWLRKFNFYSCCDVKIYHALIPSRFANILAYISPIPPDIPYFQTTVLQFLNSTRKNSFQPALLSTGTSPLLKVEAGFGNWPRHRQGARGSTSLLLISGPPAAALAVRATLPVRATQSIPAKMAVRPTLLDRWWPSRPQDGPSVPLQVSTFGNIKKWAFHWGGRKWLVFLEETPY